MARARFHKLPVAQQQAIMRAALEEFTRHGFTGASLNRIIEAAGISKGSMYYYFEDKEALYAEVVRLQLEALFREAGPFPVPSDRDADAFWATIERYYLRLMDAVAGSPQAAALARDWLTVAGRPSLQEVQKQLEQGGARWFEQALVAGQQARAVRKDLPNDLLVAIVFGMGQAIDAWLLTHDLEVNARRKRLRTLIRMIRAALSP